MIIVAGDTLSCIDYVVAIYSNSSDTVAQGYVKINKLASLKADQPSE